VLGILALSTCELWNDLQIKLISMTNNQNSLHCQIPLVCTCLLGNSSDIYIYIYIYTHTHTHTHRHYFIKNKKCVYEMQTTTARKGAVFFFTSHTLIF